MRNDLPEEHDEEDGPEEADTLRSHLIIIMQRLEEVGGGNCNIDK